MESSLGIEHIYMETWNMLGRASENNGENGLFSKDNWDNWLTYSKNLKLVYCFRGHTKVNSIWM